MVPTEYAEAVEFADWLRANGYDFHHSPNESGQAGTRNILIMMRKKKLMGVSKGFPDYTVVLKRGSLLFVELKRRKGPKGGCPSTVSPEQEKWISVLGNVDNCEACVAYGAEEAIELVKRFDFDI